MKHFAMSAYIHAMECFEFKLHPRQLFSPGNSCLAELGCSVFDCAELTDHPNLLIGTDTVFRINLPARFFCGEKTQPPTHPKK